MWEIWTNGVEGRLLGEGYDGEDDKLFDRERGFVVLGGVGGMPSMTSAVRRGGGIRGRLAFGFWRGRGEGLVVDCAGLAPDHCG